jgi:polysaccharide deacetylase family protein (PEP-CTERM system associated)
MNLERSSISNEQSTLGGRTAEPPGSAAVLRPSIQASQHPSFLLTIDVEDWFQVENFKSAIPYSSWNDMELRVEKNTNKLLDLFDSIIPNSDLGFQTSDLRSLTSEKNPRIRATFFILGWVAERLPGLVREIQNRGHEVASHGFHHHLCSEQDKKDLLKDLTESKKLLEDITGTPVNGYRAPSFSVSNDILKIIEEAGYKYDASYNSFDKHGRYGKLDLNGSPKTGTAYNISNNFYELPVSNISYQLSSVSYQPFVVPWSGGGYFRLFPLCLFKLGVQKLLNQHNAYHFYLHPWEVDPDQPRVNSVSRLFRFRHYVNIDKTIGKLKNLITSFNHCRFRTLNQYLEEIENREQRAKV